MVKPAELFDMDYEELESRVAESKQELFNLRFQLATGQLDNFARIGQVRKDIARMLTVLRQREIEEAEIYWSQAGEGRQAALSAPTPVKATPKKAVVAEPEVGEPDAAEETGGVDDARDEEE